MRDARRCRAPDAAARAAGATARAKEALLRLSITRQRVLCALEGNAAVFHRVHERFEDARLHLGILDGVWNRRQTSTPSHPAAIACTAASGTL
jgi:hypothetical protein